MTTLDGIEIENIVESEINGSIDIQQQQQHQQQQQQQQQHQQQQQQLQHHQIQEQHIIQTSGEEQQHDVIIDGSHDDSRVLVSYQGKEFFYKKRNFKRRQFIG